MEFVAGAKMISIACILFTCASELLVSLQEQLPEPQMPGILVSSAVQGMLPWWFCGGVCEGKAYWLFGQGLRWPFLGLSMVRRERGKKKDFRLSRLVNSKSTVYLVSHINLTLLKSESNPNYKITYCLVYMSILHISGK